MKCRILIAVLLVAEGTYADRTSDLELASKFSPILILTEETGGEWGDIRVTKPERVEIVMADSASGLWFSIYKQSGEYVTSDPINSPNWSPSIGSYYQNNGYRHVQFDLNRFAFVDHPDLRNYPNVSTAGGRRPGNHQTRAYFEYPGKSPTEWNSTYFGSGPQSGSHPDNVNTAYVHIYKTRHETYMDSITVIQYFYFYPYNHWWNRHEGDWQRIHVVVNSRTSSTAEVIGVEYLAHGGHFSYYNEYPYKYNDLGQPVEQTDRYYPDLTTGFAFSPRVDLKLSQGTHPIVYVGAGSHGGYPVGGRIRVHNTRATPSLHESMSHTGLVLSTQADGSHTDLWESYDLVLLPIPDREDTTNNMGLPDTLSWLGADVRWGTPTVASPHSTFGVFILAK